MAYAGRKSGGKSSYTMINKQDITFTKKDDKTLEAVLPEAYATYTSAIGRTIIQRWKEADILIQQIWLLLELIQ